MKPFPSLLLLLAPAPLLVSGCATADPHAALSGVQAQLGPQAPAPATWPLTDHERAQADAAVREILASDLTPDSAVRLGLINNRALRAVFEDLGASQAALAAATRLPNPSFNAGVRWPNHAPRGPDVEFGLDLPLLESVLLPSRRRLAEDERLATQQRVAHEILALAGSIRAAVYEVLAQEAVRARFATLAAVGDAAADLAQRQFDAGNIARIDLVQLQAAREEARLASTRAAQDLVTAREKLTRLLGLTGAQASWKLGGELPALPASDAVTADLEALALRQRLDLLAAQTRVTIAERALRQQGQSRLLTGSSAGVDTERDSDGRRLTGPRVTVQLPLFDQGQAESARLGSSLRQARDLAEALAADIGSEVRTARAALASARQAAELYQTTLLPQRRLILRETLLHYNAMQKSIYELLAAKEQQQLAERAAIEARRDYWIARTELEHAIGGALPGAPAAAVAQTTHP